MQSDQGGGGLSSALSFWQWRNSGWLVITLPVAVGWEFVRLHPGQSVWTRRNTI